MTEHKKFNLFLSFIVALSAWYFVVSNYAPVRTVTFKNVPIIDAGTENLAGRGLAVRNMSSNTVNVTLKVRRVDFDTISGDDIVVQADVSEAVEGNNGVSLSVTPPADTTYVRSNISSIDVEVGTGESKTVPVATVYDNNSEGDFEPVPSYISAKEVTVYGAAEQLEKVEYVEVRLPSSAKNESYSLQPVAVNSTGDMVHFIVANPSYISVKAEKGATKTVLLKIAVKDESGVNKQYDAIDRIIIKGPESVLAGITEVSTEKIDLTDIKENCEIFMSYDLPEGVSVAAKSVSEKLKVTISKKK